MSILPREGLYIDPIVSLIRKTILNPTIALLFVGYLKLIDTPRLAAYERPAFCAAALSVALWLNDFLTRGSRNNWVTDRTWDWSKELVVVTGGSSGIGGSIVQRLASDGVQIVVIDVIPPTYSTENKHIAYHYCDLSDESEIREVCSRIRENIGHPTVLVNNAGLSRGQMVAEGTYHDNSITLRTNLLAPLLLSKEFLPHMIERNHGHIVNISSLSAYIPPAGLADYAASKAGLVAFHESLGLELKYHHGSTKVRTSLAVLSFIKTPLFKGELNQPHFFFPLMHVDTVGDAVVDTLYSGYGRTMFLPGVFRYFAGLRGAPEWIQNIVLGSSQSLKVDFKGRQMIDPVTGKLREL
ncbi:uncharacterized protein ACHE_40540S [Aspergillus chevalieri]|uniref:Uncharacterized protein n=1 Tax=Aspergillus chevalieri TaxID=182096 RepID=A0A7R7VNL1_ASPCH|nr:uncharacterized protein ACHE_40540S [Aspergillus chevalieri]BCR87976.1 hypothetical protein ACHE_40540S [Aspergillus chevalieri]